MCSGDVDGCRNELNLSKLCAKCIKAGCAKVRQIISNDICSQSIEAKNLSIEDGLANNLCVSGKIQSSQLSADTMNANFLCSQNATLNNACIDNLMVGNFSPQIKYRAAATLSANLSYTLGSVLNWDAILDDPSNGITLAPFNYTVAVGQAGYYIMNYHLDTNTLSGSVVISGVPIGVQTIMVNGNKLVDHFCPYLSFSNTQSSNLTVMVLLNAGDVITMKYEILMFDPLLGLIPFVGTVNIEGNGSLVGHSYFDILQLSGLSSTILCEQCPPVSIPCAPFVNPCMPLGMTAEQNPCDSCQ